MEVSVEDVEELLAAFESVATHSGDWLDQQPMTTRRVRDSLLRGLTVAANGVRRGRAMLHDGDALIHVIEETQGTARDVTEILSAGPEYVRGLYEGVARLSFVMWRRCQEHGAEQ